LEIRTGHNLVVVNDRKSKVLSGKFFYSCKWVTCK